MEKYNKYLAQEADIAKDMYLDDGGEVIAESYKIKNKGDAEWSLSKLRALQAEIEENKAIAAEEIDRINNWLESQNRIAENSAEYFEGLLTEYAITQRQQDPDFKKVKLPSGLVRFKAQQDKFVFDDEKTIEYLKSSLGGKFVEKQVIEKYNKNDVKKYIKETGEMWDGVNVVPQEDKLEIKVEKGEK